MAHAEILQGEERILVDTAWNERELIKQVPGVRWNPTGKFWHIPLTWTACIILRGVFREALTIGPELTAWAWNKKKRVDRLLEIRTWTEPMWDYNPKLYPFQAVGSVFIHCAKGAILGDEMGTGKTIQVLTTLQSADEFLPALVVCPNSVKPSWGNEAMKWGVAQPYVVTGNATQRKNILTEAAADPSAIIIVNYEALRTLTRLAPYGSTRLKRCRACDKTNGEVNLRASQCEVHPKELNKIAFKTVVVDEAHKIKNPQSKQTRAVWAMTHMPSVEYRWALTGTPLANHPGDLWSLLHSIAPLDFPTKTGFVDRYCLQSWNPFGGLDIVGLNPANRDEFFSLLDPRFRRMPKALVLTQLPPKLRVTRWVDMSPAQARAYKQLETGLAAQTPGGTLIAANPLVARTRQMQFASSMVTVVNPTEDITDWQVELSEPSTKLDELEDVLDELGGRPAVICSEQRKLIELAATRLTKRGESFGMITGAISPYEREIALRDFQAGKLRLLLFTVKAGGTGLTMTAADTIIFLQRADSMIDNKQAEDRVHRIGSEIHENVTVIDIVTRGTVEEKQIGNLTDKFMRLQEIARDRATILAAGGDTSDLNMEEENIMGMRL